MSRAEKRFQVLLSWIYDVLLSGGLYLVLASFLQLGVKEALLYLAGVLWLFVPLSLSWFFIRRIRSVILYAAASTAVTAVSVVLMRDWKDLLTVVSTAMIFFVRALPRLSGGDDPEELVQRRTGQIPTVLDRPHPLRMLVTVGCYIFVIAMQSYELLTPVFVLLVCEVPVCFLYRWMDREEDYLAANRRVANVPVRSVKHMGHMVLLISMFVIAACILPAALYGEEPLKELLRPREHTVQIDPEELETEEPMQMGGGSMLPMELMEESYEPPAWLQTLWNLLFYGIFAACVFMFSILLYRSFRRMARSFSQGVGEDEVILIEDEEPADYAGRIMGGRARRRAVGQKIRREYRRIVKRRLKEQPKGWETPTELEHAAGLADMDPRVHELYEKARYAKDTCTQQETEEFFRKSGTV